MSEQCVLKYFEDKLDLIESTIKAHLTNITLYEEKLYNIENIISSDGLDLETINELKTDYTNCKKNISETNKEIKKLNIESDKLFSEINKVSRFSLFNLI